MSKQPSRQLSLSQASCCGNCQRFCAQAQMFTHSPLHACPEVSLPFCSAGLPAPALGALVDRWVGQEQLSGRFCQAQCSGTLQGRRSCLLLSFGECGWTAPTLLGLCLGSRSWTLLLVPERRRKSEEGSRPWVGGKAGDWLSPMLRFSPLMDRMTGCAFLCKATCAHIAQLRPQTFLLLVRGLFSAASWKEPSLLHFHPFEYFSQ